MNRKTSRRSVWLFWATLLVVSLACMPGTSTPIPAAPTPAPFTPIPVTPDETTKDELFLGLATPTLATGIQPAPDDGPTLDDLKAELFYGGVGGGMFCDAAETPPLDALPAVAFNTRALSPSETVGLCLFGFPQGQNLHVSLHHPETGASFYEILSDPDPTLTPEGVPLVETSFWWPVGMLPGPWIFIVETEGATVETEFDVPPRTAPAISLIPESGVDPLHRRYDYAPGEMLLVRG
ncbi:MAG: hypothetical protein JXB35_00320, partial [Anaerolineae bacterium]|nr:hypothetical protein [Anaerolineae bacterium]